MNAGRVSAWCGVIAALLFIAGVFLWFNNLSVDVAATDFGLSGPAGSVGCPIAPWDAGMNGNSNGPGGEHLRPFYDEVATECYSKNIARYNAAITSEVLALLVFSAGVVAVIRSRRPVSVPG